MAQWNSKVKIKHLLTYSDDYADVQQSMNAIADVLEGTPQFDLMDRSFIERMRNIPPGDEIVPPVEYANRMLERIYDYADNYRIWLY